jgi:hypothetical protein
MSVSMLSLLKKTNSSVGIAMISTCIAALIQAPALCQDPTPLSGTITASPDLSALQASIVPAATAPPGLQAFHIVVKNGSKSALFVNGDKALMSCVLPKNTTDVLEHRWPTPTPPRQVGAIVMDMLTTGMYSATRDAAIQHGPVLKRYGRDQARREVESMRFGGRVLWPGDEAEGNIYFDAGQKLDANSLELPVSRWPKKDAFVMLKISVH